MSPKTFKMPSLKLRHPENALNGTVRRSFSEGVAI